MAYIPKNGTEVTEPWLRDFLQANDLRLLSAELLPGGAMSDLLQVRIATASDLLPETLVLKVPSSTPTSLQLALHFDSYRKESLFYRHLAPRLAAQAPRCHANELAANGSRLALALEDLTGLAEVSQLESASEAQTMQAMRTLAQLHASAWPGRHSQLSLLPDAASAPLPEAHPWLPRFADAVAASQPGFTEMVAQALAATGIDLSPETAATLRQYTDNPQIQLPAFLELPQTLIHGDYRTANLRFPSPKEPARILDWGDYSWGPAAFDVVNFLVTSLSPEDRQAWEEDALAEYSATLAQAGIAYPPEACLEHCQRLLPPCLYLPALLAALGDLPLATTLLHRLAAAFEQLPPPRGSAPNE